MLNKIKNWFLQFGIKPKTSINNPFSVNVEQEDTRSYEIKKRVRKAIEKQQESMDIRALKAHDSDCKDNWTCTKEKCFKWSADTIVSKSDAPEETERRKKSYNRKKSLLKSLNRKNPERLV